MRASRLIWIAWSAVTIVTALRAAFAASLPLTGDEAYYWEWSRRLAAGYVDHPPAVAFAIAAFGWLGHSPLAVRLGFVLCGLGAAVAAGGTATVLTNDRRAGAIAALAVTLAPMMTVAFGMASPDGPYALAWAVALYFAARASRDGATRWFVLLGVALGAALMSRFFGLALAAGIVIALRRREVWLSALIAFVLWVPFLAWNQSHHWISFTFALLGRHESQPQALRPLTLYALGALAFSPGLWIAATFAAVRVKQPLLSWTALPLSIFLILLAFHERVEVYWFIGPFVSLCIAFGCAFVQWPQKTRVVAGTWAMAPAVLLTALIFGAGLAPGAVYASLRASGVHLADGGPFEMFTYRPLSSNVAQLTGAPGAIAMTDGYGFSSLLDFYGGLMPVVIGYDPQGEEARRWFTDADRPRKALFVDKVPLDTRPDFALRLSQACARVVPGPVLSYAFAPQDRAVPPRRYYTTWCDGMSAHSVAILRWQSKPKALASGFRAPPREQPRH